MMGGDVMYSIASPYHHPRI